MPPPPPSSIDRRVFLRRVVRASAAVAALGSCGVIAAIRTSGYAIDATRAKGLRAIEPWQLVVLDAVSARLVRADVPYGSPGAPPTPREALVSEFVDAFLAESPRESRRDCRALISVVEHAFPLACGERHRFTALDGEAQDVVLAKMESSSIEMIAGGFRALKSLVMMGYYRDPRTWGVLAYDGPLVDRPPSGSWTPVQFIPKGTVFP